MASTDSFAEAMDNPLALCHFDRLPREIIERIFMSVFTLRFVGSPDWFIETIDARAFVRGLYGFRIMARAMNDAILSLYLHCLASGIVVDFSGHLSHLPITLYPHWLSHTHGLFLNQSEGPSLLTLNLNKVVLYSRSIDHRYPWVMYLDGNWPMEKRVFTNLERQTDEMRLKHIGEWLNHAGVDWIEVKEANKPKGKPASFHRSGLVTSLSSRKEVYPALGPSTLQDLARAISGAFRPTRLTLTGLKPNLFEMDEPSRETLYSYLKTVKTLDLCAASEIGPPGFCSLEHGKICTTSHFATPNEMNAWTRFFNCCESIETLKLSLQMEWELSPRPPFIIHGDIVWMERMRLRPYTTWIFGRLFVKKTNRSGELDLSVKFPNLQVLILDYIFFTAEEMLQFLARHPKIRKLVISGSSYGFTKSRDPTLGGVFELFAWPELFDRIWGHSKRAIPAVCPNLEELVFDGVVQPRPDTAGWVEAHGDVFALQPRWM